MRIYPLGYLSFFIAADAFAGLSSSQPFEFYNADGAKVGTGTAYTKSIAAPKTSTVSKSSAFSAPTASAAALLVGDTALPGVMPGQSSVSPSGVAGYSVPISVPRSLAGFGPSLAIEYNSQAQSGLLGVGWNISGLQQMTRCPQTIAQDGAIVGVRFTATDRFCLGGQRLIKVAGTAYGANGAEYRTEIDSFSKIISYGAAGTGPQYFKVWTKSGQVMEFGNSTDSRLPVNTTDATGTPTSQATIQAWSLNRVSDRKGNYWTVSYSHEIGSGMLYPTRIDYAGNTAAVVTPTNSVQFEFEARTAQDSSQQFQAGSRSTFNKRLKTIRTYAGSTQAGEYRFSYETTDTGGHAYTQSRLKSLTECHYKTGTPNCFESTDLEWTSDASFNITNATSTKRPVSLAGITPSAFQAMVADINGDGRADIVYANITASVLRIRSMFGNTGPAASDFGAAIVSQPSGTYTVDSQGFSLTDVNVDGKADLVLGSIGTTGFKVYTLLSNGDGTFAPATATTISTASLSTAYRFIMTDVNSDGLPDYVAFFVDGTTATVRVALRAANGTLGAEQVSTMTLSAWSGETIGDQTIADIDGDGFPDAVIAARLSNNDYVTYIAKGTGTGTFATTPIAVVAASASAIASQTDAIIRSKLTYNPAAYHIALQDVNRDGLVDVILDMAVSTTYCTGSGCPVHPVLDICKTNGCSFFFQGAHVALSKGDLSFRLEGGFPPDAGAVASSTIASWLPTYGDLDGDGTLDVIRVNLDSTYTPWILLSFGMGNGDFYLPVGGNLADTPLVSTAGLTGVGTVAVQNDVNVDGVADIIIPLVYKNTSDGETMSAHVTRIVKDGTALPQQHNLLSRIKRGSQITEEFDYQTLPSSNALYAKEATAVFPQIDLNAPLFVVSQSRSKLNAKLQKTTDYHYEGAKADLRGRGFLGFRKSKSTTTTVASLPTGGTQTLTEEQETTFRQDFPFIGQPVLTTRKMNGVLVMRSASNASTDFIVTNPYLSVYFPRATKVLQSAFDPISGVLLATTEQSLGHDTYGNVLNQSVTTRNADQTETFVTTTANTYFPVDLNAWKVDFLQIQQVTSQRTNRPDIVNMSSWDYDTDGLLKQEIVEPNTAALRLQTDYLRDAYGNVTFTTVSGAGDPAYPDTAIQSRTTEMRYEAGTGYLAGVFNTKAINPLTHTVTRTFDPLTGGVLTEIEANNLATTVTLDAIGRETLRVNPDTTQLSTTRETCSSFVTVGTGTTNCETGEYIKITMTQTGSAPIYTFLEGAGREIRQVKRAFDGSNYIIARTEYDEAGRVKRVSNPAFNTVAYASVLWTTHEYDAAGRPTKQTLPGSRVTTTAYNGLITTITNPKSQVRTEISNAAGEVIQIKDAANQLLTYERDAQGRISKTQDAKSNQIVFVIDKLGRKTQQQDADLGTWNYRYNVLGELVWQQDAKNQVASFTYDKIGRPLTRNEIDLISTWTWDTAVKGVGKLAKLTGDNGFERTFGYDGFGRSSQTTTKKTFDPTAQVSDPDFIYSTTFDTAGRPETLTYPTGFGYKNIYDVNGYLKQVVDKSSGALYWKANTRDEDSHVTGESIGNGVNTTRAYNLHTRQLASIYATVSPTNVVQNDGYDFDAVGNLQLRSQYWNTGVNEFFYYDTLNRMTEARLLSNSGIDSTRKVVYDEIGNIKSRSEVGVYSYTGCGGAHRVCKIAGAINSNFTYDTNGNQLTGNGRNLTWTSYNYPVQIIQGSTTESFLYSPERERVRRTSVENGQTTTTIYLNPRIDLGGTFEKTVKPGNIVEYTHHVYAGGQVVGSVVTTAPITANVALWSTDLSTAPTTTSPNATGLTLPAVDTNGLIAWDNTTGNGRLAFTTKPTTVSTGVYALAQRSYLNDNVLFKAEVTTTANTGNGRYLLMEVYNGGSDAAASKTNRRHGIYFRGGIIYSYYSDGLVINSTTGNLTQTTKTLGAAANNTTYVAEVETTPLSSTLYVYPKGQSRANGYSHSLEMDWRSLNGTGTLARRMRVFAYGNTTESVNVTYLDNVSESRFIATEPRYFHTDHQGSATAITDFTGKVTERMSYDAWGKRRNPSGIDDVLSTVAWSTDLTTAPTTANPNATGITMPASDANGLISWDNSTGNGRLAFSTKPTTAGLGVNVTGQRTYLNQNMTFRGEVTTTTNTGNGRYLLTGIYNTGSTAAASKTYRRHFLYFRSNKAYAYFTDGTYIDPVSGNLLTTTLDLNYPVADNTSYVMEVETTSTSSVLYLYKKGESRSQGVRHALVMDWRSGSGTLVRRLIAHAYGNTTESVNVTYLDNLSETVITPQNTLKGQMAKRGYTLHEHLDSIGLVHMNGRVYDPLVGRFVSADPNVFYPENMQDFNRYSYVHNNPLSATDPSGFASAFNFDTSGITAAFERAAFGSSWQMPTSPTFNFVIPTGLTINFGANSNTAKGMSGSPSLISFDMKQGIDVSSGIRARVSNSEAAMRNAYSRGNYGEALSAGAKTVGLSFLQNLANGAQGALETFNAPYSMASGVRDGDGSAAAVGLARTGLMFGMARFGGAMGEGTAAAQGRYNFNLPCFNSFDASTPVWTERGLLAIGLVSPSLKVLAYDEPTQTFAYQPVTQVLKHQDESITSLTIIDPETGKMETLTTTPEHPFYVEKVVDTQPRPKPIGHEELSNRWVGAGHLQVGDKIKQADGTVGLVHSLSTTSHSQVMYNLTVDKAHTFFVGSGGWLVHNGCGANGSLSIAEQSGMLRDAANLKGNFNLGQASATESGVLGESWVGSNFRVASDGRTLVSSDSLRTYRPPAAKSSPYATTGIQANFERLEIVKGRPIVIGNGHLNITP